MANILLTYRCNLRCPYCFANEFVGKENTDITIENLLKVVSFITRTGPANIGLIGGEPTLHPGFPVIMELLIANPMVRGIRVSTNGLLIDHFINQLIHPKMDVCINCNSPNMIGEKAFSSLQKNLDLLILKYNMKEQIQLGINLYSNDLDYSFIMNLLQRYDIHRLRTSITVPDFSSSNYLDAMDYFKERKKFLLQFYKDMESIQVLPYSDCNRPPFCIWDDEEKQWLREYIAKFPDRHSNLTDPCSMCVPAIDILPDLQAIRCFGMSDFLKVPITDFSDLDDITHFFLNEIDADAYKLPTCADCKECHEFKTRHCIGCCIGYKASRIRSCNKAIANL